MEKVIWVLFESTFSIWAYPDRLSTDKFLKFFLLSSPKPLLFLDPPAVAPHPLLLFKNFTLWFFFLF